MSNQENVNNINPNDKSAVPIIAQKSPFFFKNIYYYNDNNNINYIPNNQINNVQIENNYINDNNYNISNNNQVHLNIQNIKFDQIPEEEKIIRLGFIRKVYGILSLQLLITFGLICFTFIHKFKDFLHDNLYLFYIAVILEFIILIVLVCFKKIARKVPINYILLFTWTFLESFIISTLTSFYNYKIVISAVGITVGMCIGLTAYACYTKKDFTYCGGILFFFSFILMFFGFFGLLFGKWVNILFCSCGIAVFGLYLIYDTQLILRNFNLKYSIDDYIIAALNLYVDDIIEIFIYILRCIEIIKR